MTVEQRTEIETQVGPIVDTAELQQQYSVHSFLAPYVSVTRKADNVRGTMLFEHSPRFYYRFKAEN